MLKDDDYYVNLVIVAVRNLYTFLKNLKPKVSRYTEAHYRAARHELVNPSRFDLIEKGVKMESNKTLFNSKYNDMMREYSQQLSKRKSESQVPSQFKGGVTPFEIK